LNKKGQLTATASPAQPRRPEILRLASATAFYGGGGNFLRLATAYELYGGLRRLTAAAWGSRDKETSTRKCTVSKRQDTAYTV